MIIDKINELKPFELDKRVHYYISKGVRGDSFLPNYSSDFSVTSMALQKELKKSFYRVSIVLNDYMDEWIVYFEGRDEESPMISASAKTPALALCRAYLYWKMIGE